MSVQFALGTIVAFWALQRHQKPVSLPNGPILSTFRINIYLLWLVVLNLLVKLQLSIFVYIYPNTSYVPLYIEILCIVFRLTHCAILTTGMIWLIDIWLQVNRFIHLHHSHCINLQSTGDYSAALSNYYTGNPLLKDHIRQIRIKGLEREPKVLAISLAVGCIEAAVHFGVRRTRGVKKDVFAFLDTPRSPKIYSGVLHAMTTVKHIDMIFVVVGVCVVPLFQFNKIPTFASYEEMFGHSEDMYEANLCFIYYLLCCAMVSMIHWLGTKFMARIASIIDPNWQFFSEQVFWQLQGVVAFLIYFLLYLGNAKRPEEGNEVKQFLYRYFVLGE